MDDEADHPVPPNFIARLERSIAQAKAGCGIDARTFLAASRERARQRQQERQEAESNAPRI